MLKIYEKRSGWLCNLLEHEGMDAFVLLVKESYNWESCYYLSGFRGSSAALLISQKDRILITDARYTEQASKQTPYQVIDRERTPLPDVLTQQIKKMGLKNIAMEGDKISHKIWLTIANKDIVLNFFDKSDIVLKLRRKKDAEEIKTIRQAARIAEAAFLETLRSACCGMSELEFANMLEYRLKLLGAEGAWGSSPFVVASGIRSALPHGAPTEKKFAKGEWVTVDFGARYGGYVCDITRNFALSKISSFAAEIYEILQGAQKEAENILSEGVQYRKIDAAARDFIVKCGWGENFSHGLGHGIGLEVHEAPGVSASSEEIATYGDVITIEPGIYAQGRGGMRLEDNYALTADGKFEKITSGLSSELFLI